MGGTTFSTLAHGKTVEEAYLAAVDTARWDHGHSGYTGTIAEKSGFIAVPLKARVRAFDTERRLMEAPEAMWEESDPDVTASKDSRKAWRWLAEKYGPSTARRYVELYDDKWGPAVAIPLSPAEEHLYRERHDLKGRRLGVWLFCGWASC